MPDDLHERLRAEMITTNGAGRGHIVRNNQCASLIAEDAEGGISPLLAVCHEAALAPEEGGVPACGEDRRVASGTEGSPKWLSEVALRSGSPKWLSEVALRTGAPNWRSDVLHEGIHGLRGRWN